MELTEPGRFSSEISLKWAEAPLLEVDRTHLDSELKYRELIHTTGQKGIYWPQLSDCWEGYPWG